MDEKNLFDWQSGDLIEEGKMNLINKSIRDIWIQLDELSTETGEISIEALQVKYEIEHNNSMYFNVQDFLDYVGGKLLSLDKKDSELLETIKNKKVTVDEIEYKTETYVTLKDFLDSIQAILQEMSDEMDLTIETVNDMNEKVIDVTEGFNEVETEVISVKNSIKLVNSTMDLIKADIEALQNKKIDISEISYVNGTYITLKSFLDYVGSKLNSLDSKDTEINNAVTVLRNAITTLQNKKYNATDIAFTHETYTTVDSFVRYLGRVLENVSTDVDELKETLEKIEDEIDIDVYSIKYTKRDCITLGNYLDFIDIIIDDLYDITDTLEESKADKSYVEEKIGDLDFSDYVTKEEFNELELIETSEIEPINEDVVIWINTSQDNNSTDILARINDDTVASNTTWSSDKIKDTINNLQLGGGSDESIDIDFSIYAKKDDIPTQISQLTNDRGFITSVPSEYITEKELNDKGYLTEHQDLSDYAKKTDMPTKVSELTNDRGFITRVPSEYVTKTELTDKNYATKDYVEDSILKVQIGSSVDLSAYATKDYVNDSIANAEINVDLSDYAKKTDIPTVPTKTSELTNDSNYISSIPSEYVTETELNNKGYLTQHQDLSAYAKKNDIPTKTSQLTNDSNYISSIPSEYVTETELNNKGYLTEHQDLSAYAKKTDVPTRTSSLINDSGYITEARVIELINSIINSIGLVTETRVIELINNIIGGGENPPIEKPCTNIILNKSSLTFTSYNSQVLTATVTPSDTTDTITWRSSNTSIATVNNGVVVPNSNGSCIITATCGSVSVSCNVTVNIKVNYSITNNLTNVTNSNKATSVVEGSSYYAELECANNYKITSVIIIMDGVDITDSVYTPIEDENITTYSITNNLTNVTNSNKATSVLAGETYYAELECADNHKIVSVAVIMDGVDITDSVYTPINTPITTYSITNNLTNVTNSNKATSITEGSSYYAELECANNHKITSVIVNMNGMNITDSVYTPIEDE